MIIRIGVTYLQNTTTNIKNGKNSNASYCVEMRQAFRGIKIDADLDIADEITNNLERSRQTKYTPSIPHDAGNINGRHKPKLNILGGTNNHDIPQATVNVLQWTTRQCGAQANNWFICEKQLNIPTKSHTKYRKRGNRRNKSTSSTKLNRNRRIPTKGQ